MHKHISQLDWTKMRSDIKLFPFIYRYTSHPFPCSPNLICPNLSLERAILAKVGRRYKTLTDEQVQLWRQFASRFHGTGTQDYKITACNAFVRHNCNRALIGLEPIAEPPAQVISVPAVSFINLLVTPSLIQFTGIIYPGDNFRLAIGMSKAVSTGVTYGGGRAVIVDPNFIPDHGVADITRIYTDRLGVRPIVGCKYLRNRGYGGQTRTSYQSTVNSQGHLPLRI